MKMPNMGNSFVYLRHSSVSGVNSFKMMDVNCGLIPDRLSEPARLPYVYDICLRNRNSESE